MSNSPRFPKLAAMGTWLGVLALALSGCRRVDAALRSDRETYLWLVLPIAGFALVGTFLINIRRKAQFSSWDLRRSAEEPSLRSITMTTIWIAAGFVLAFAIYDLALIDDIAFRQKLLNAGFWTAGNLIGGALALLVGLRLAEPARAADRSKKEE